MKKILCLILTLLAISLAAESFSQESRTKSVPKPEGTLRIALAELSEQIVDPILGRNSNKINLCLMYDWLVGTNDDGSYNPDKSVAYKWEGSSDKKTWSFWIRKGIKFHNGRPFTAEAFKVTIDDVKAPGSKSVWAAYCNPIKEIEVVDDLNLVLKFEEPSRPQLRNLKMEGIIEPKAFKELGNAQAVTRGLKVTGKDAMSAETVISYTILK